MIPEQWGETITVPIYKGKGGMGDYQNYVAI